jgi:adenylyl- and sulfurtransferase ThiI
MVFYLIRYAEIALKGKNRSFFENQLIQNIKACLSKRGAFGTIRKLPGRLLLEANQEVDLRVVFGIVSYSLCKVVPSNYDSLAENTLSLTKGFEKTDRFRISARRLTKDHPLSSNELNKRLGALVVENYGLKVDLEHFNLDIGLEIAGKEAFFFTKTISCFGGLPSGVEGRVLALIDSDAAVLAALLLAKRGCEVVCVKSQNYSLSTGQESLMNAFLGEKPRGFPFSGLDSLSREERCVALVVSDTLSSLKDYDFDGLILRPLVAFSDEEILLELEKYKSAVR